MKEDDWRPVCLADELVVEGVYIGDLEGPSLVRLNVGIHGKVQGGGLPMSS